MTDDTYNVPLVEFGVNAFKDLIVAVWFVQVLHIDFQFSHYLSLFSSRLANFVKHVMMTK